MHALFGVLRECVPQGDDVLVCRSMPHTLRAQQNPTESAELLSALPLHALGPGPIVLGGLFGNERAVAWPVIQNGQCACCRQIRLRLTLRVHADAQLLRKIRALLPRGNEHSCLLTYHLLGETKFEAGFRQSCNAPRDSFRTTLRKYSREGFVPFARSLRLPRDPHIPDNTQ